MSWWGAFAGSALAVAVVLVAAWVLALRVPLGIDPGAGPAGSSNPPTVASPRSNDGSIASPSPRGESASVPSVHRFEVLHFPKIDARHFDRDLVGILGLRSFGARADDHVTVRAELSAPAYAYLIAFRPDGNDDICDPDDEDIAPSRKRQPNYPPSTKSGERYALNEGAGLHAFALVISREPLPPYREWKRRVGAMPWAAKLPCEPGVVWCDDGGGLRPLLADDPAGLRGKGAKARGSGEPVARLASWLRGLPGIDAVTVEAFSVEPAPGS